MKQKPRNLVLRFLPTQWVDPENPRTLELIAAGKVYLFESAEENRPHTWSWHGPVDLARIRQLLTDKQYSEFRQGKRNEFIMERTRHDAWLRMKKANGAAVE
jgi:hypothetical protein